MAAVSHLRKNLKKPQRSTHGRSLGLGGAQAWVRSFMRSPRCRNYFTMKTCLLTRMWADRFTDRLIQRTNS
jgi:hypothetical protein